jgi:hypothetical protein
VPTLRSLYRPWGGLLWSAALLAALAAPAHGFEPGEDLGHLDIVRKALRGQSFRTRDGIEIAFAESVIESSGAAVAGVDGGAAERFLRGKCRNAQQEFGLPEAHWDDELLRERSDRVAQIRRDLLALRPPLSDPAADRARRDLGRALHTIQDFRAHSN